MMISDRIDAGDYYITLEARAANALAAMMRSDGAVPRADFRCRLSAVVQQLPALQRA
jgi:hypothetical protein